MDRSGRRSTAEDGSALVEFVFLAVLMLVPIVYLIVALGRIQAGALAVEQGAREAGRAFVTAPDGGGRTWRGLERRRRWPTATRGSLPPAADQLSVACSALALPHRRTAG